MKGWLNREPFKTRKSLTSSCRGTVLCPSRCRLSPTRSGAMPLRKIGFVGFGSRSECYAR